MSGRIHFIGTIHSDPQGKERLARALGYEKPDLITVESSKEVIEYIEQEALPLMKQKVDSLGFYPEVAEYLKEELVKLNYEIEVSRNYAREHTIPLSYVDHPSKLENTKLEVISFCHSSKANFDYHLSSLNKRIAIPIADKEYQTFQSLFDKSFAEAEAEEKKIVDKEAHLFDHRDIFMAKNIEAVLRSGKLVHVGGIAHCLQDTFDLRTLFSRLQKYAPTRATLKWYENR